MPSINLVISTTNIFVNYVISNLLSPTSSSRSSSGSVACFSVMSQLELLGLILVGFLNPSMENQPAIYLTRYLEFWGKGFEDVEQHWFLCEALWRSCETLDVNKLVEFQTTLRG
jgi:hypothetical protein